MSCVPIAPSARRGRCVRASRSETDISSPWPSALSHQASGFSLQPLASGYELPTTNYQLGTTNYELPLAEREVDRLEHEAPLVLAARGIAVTPGRRRGASPR